MRWHSIKRNLFRRSKVRDRQDQDQGSTLILALVVIIVGAFFVLPIMTYIMTVNQASRLRIEGANSSEVVRGGLRSVLYDPAALYSACSNSGATDASAVDLAVPPGLAITTQCTTTANASQWVPTDLRWALTTTMVGASAAIPPPYDAPPSRPDLDGTISELWCTSAISESVPCGRTYPNNSTTDPLLWSSAGEVTTTSEGSKIFLPYLPSVIDTPGFAGGYNVDVGFGNTCKVYFPGRYTDDIVITGTTPVYFVSGVYYFEKTLRFSGDAQVVAGAGATEGCIESDAIAVADAGYADATSTGVGATFVFGAQGRMMIDTATPSTTPDGMSIIINRRLVDPLDPDVVMNNVAIMSVNGVSNGTTTDPYDVPGVIHVPAGQVNADPPVDPLNQEFNPSTLIPTTVPTGGFPCAAPPVVALPGCPIVDINLTSTASVFVNIPGYISVPQGGVSINTASGMSAAKKIALGGGVLTATIGVSADRPESLQIGLLNSVVQRTFKIVSQTTNSRPRVTATAMVQVNQTGGYAINSWVTSFG
jgi:hypothetical protein